MKQLSFKFAEYPSEYSDLHSIYQKDKKEKEDFANKYTNESCGWLHLAWDIDAYWAKIVKDFLLPGCESIYQELVKKNYSENNKLYSCTGSYQYWYIPTQSESRKVFVQDSYPRTYLFVCDESKLGKTLHVRQVWESWDPNKD